MDWTNWLGQHIAEILFALYVGWQGFEARRANLRVANALKTTNDAKVGASDQLAKAQEQLIATLQRTVEAQDRRVGLLEDDLVREREQTKLVRGQLEQSNAEVDQLRGQLDRLSDTVAAQAVKITEQSKARG